MPPQVLQEDPDYLVLWKPPGMATAPLTANETGTLLDWVGQRYPEVLETSGRKPIEGGLVHRLDTATTGLVLVARSTAALEAATAAAARGGFSKRYRARCFAPGTPWQVTQWPFCGSRPSPDAPAGRVRPGTVITSGFRPYGPGRRRVAPVSGATGQQYTTTIDSLTDHDDGTITVGVTLTRGFRHQVRVHLSWSGVPILGDRLYAPEGPSPPTTGLQLAAVGIELVLPDRTLRFHEEHP